MQHRTFDRLTRNIAARPTRRGFLGGIGALIAAGFATTALGQRRDFEALLAAADDDHEEQMVLLFEKVGAIAEEHNGTCGELAEKARKFEETYHDQLESLRAEEASWTREHRLQHAETYGDRRDAVVAQVTAARERCKSVGGTTASPVAATPTTATPAAALPFDNLAALVPAGMNRTTVHTWAQDTAGCTTDSYNFMLDANCVKEHSDWASPSIQWPGLCENWTIDDNCTLCENDAPGTTTGPEFCAKWWPQDCVESGENVCHIEYHDTHGDIAAAMCDADEIQDKIFTDSVRCYSTESGWSSREFSWKIYCPDGRIKHNCIDCQTGFDNLEGAEACVKYWPDQCQTSSGKNICYIGFHVTCCDENCPVGSTDCAISALESLGDDYECAQCLLSWCGSTSKCLEYCATEDCCDQACSSDYVPPPPGGEVKRGTPVPLGTPAGTPAAVGTPGTQVPTPPPGTPATEVPTVVPTAPPTEVPTEPPGTPSASPTA